MYCHMSIFMSKTMHCSNLVSFEDSLRASASAFDAALLREVRSGAVDLALDRHPAELLLRDYLQVLAGMRAISASADGDTLVTFPYIHYTYIICIVHCAMCVDCSNICFAAAAAAGESEPAAGSQKARSQ